MLVFVQIFKSKAVLQISIQIFSIKDFFDKSDQIHKIYLLFETRLQKEWSFPQDYLWVNLIGKPRFQVDS